MRMSKQAVLEVKALYSVAELARGANVGADRLRRVLRASGVTLLRGGRVLLVPLSEIREKIPALWESILAADRRRSPRRSQTPAR